ncbi:hypothetical protein BG20_I0828 [Candidatus Nitrosarchaeum limnium BG20]|uniref:Uncharacterized protein n=2 Tax=Nitrosarchaeum TaxID=1007082 RepID=S2ENZ5_9ARCH|nr:hypothetical protein BG20_I0828 [Candidatus Nitrosarchaeum limnium BG20]
MTIYYSKVNGVTKWFEDESCLQLHHHRSSEIKKKMSHYEEIQKSILRKLQYLSEEIQQIKNNNEQND